MTSELLNVYDVPGNNVFFCIWNAAGQILDHADQTFKALAAPPTTPGLAATEVTDKGGVNESAYEVALNLANVNATPAIAAFRVEAYRRAGGSVNLANDLLLGSDDIRVAASVLASGSVGEVLHGYSVLVNMNVTSTAGDEIQLIAILLNNGKPVTLAGTETCVFECYEFSETVVKFPSPSAVTPTANGQFEAIVEDPALTDDCEVILKATITIGAITVSGSAPFVIVGGA